MTSTGLSTRFACNPIPWFNRKADPSDPDSEDLWLIADPAFATQYPAVLAELRSAGFDAAPIGAPPGMSSTELRTVLDALGLRPAPGYVTVSLPEDHRERIRPGSREWERWFDGVRLHAATSLFFGLDTTFLAPELDWGPAAVRANEAAAVGASFDQDRLDRLVEVIAHAAQILRSEGVTAGLHNHVGTWIETEYEIRYVLDAIDPAVLGASLDIGHLAWAGIDPVKLLQEYRGRLVDVHVKDIDAAVAARTRVAPAPYGWGPSRGLFREPGDGDIDLTGVLAALGDDFHGWIIVEVDRTSLEPIESARRSWQWVQRVTNAE